MTTSLNIMGLTKEKETMPPELEALAKRVKAIRKAMDENQLEFAEHCGLNVETLSRIECQKDDVRLSTAQKIAAYVDLTVSELLSTEFNDSEEKEKTS